MRSVLNALDIFWSSSINSTRLMCNNFIEWEAPGSWLNGEHGKGDFLGRKNFESLRLIEKGIWWNPAWWKSNFARSQSTITVASRGSLTNAIDRICCADGVIAVMLRSRWAILSGSHMMESTPTYNYRLILCSAGTLCGNDWKKTQQQAFNNI